MPGQHCEHRLIDNIQPCALYITCYFLTIVVLLEMADSAPKVAAEELVEGAGVVDQKAEILASQIRSSKHFIAFTGAGISTSAGMS